MNKNAALVDTYLEEHFFFLKRNLITAWIEMHNMSPSIDKIDEWEELHTYVFYFRIWHPSSGYLNEA